MQILLQEMVSSQAGGICLALAWNQFQPGLDLKSSDREDLFIKYI